MWDVWLLLCFAPVQIASALQVRGLGVGCEALHLRSIPPNSQDGLGPPDISMNLHIYTALQGALVLWYPISPVVAL